MKSKLTNIVIAAAVFTGVSLGVLISPSMSEAAIRPGPSWDDATTVISSLCLAYLPDGGAQARIEGSARLADGGSGGPTNTVFIELGGARRTTALNALDDAKLGWNARQP